jgi:hypothetical protein
MHSTRARLHGTVTQHTLTSMRSIAALGLGLGIKGHRRRICSTAFVVIVATEAVEAVTV